MPHRPFAAPPHYGRCHENTAGDHFTRARPGDMIWTLMGLGGSDGPDRPLNLSWLTHFLTTPYINVLTKPLDMESLSPLAQPTPLPPRPHTHTHIHRWRQISSATPSSSPRGEASSVRCTSSQRAHTPGQGSSQECRPSSSSATKEPPTERSPRG